jgi:hypothetical protein
LDKDSDPSSEVTCRTYNIVLKSNIFAEVFAKSAKFKVPTWFSLDEISYYTFLGTILVTVTVSHPDSNNNSGSVKKFWILADPDPHQCAITHRTQAVVLEEQFYIKYLFSSIP